MFCMVSKNGERCVILSHITINGKGKTGMSIYDTLNEQQKLGVMTSADSRGSGFRQDESADTPDGISD